MERLPVSSHHLPDPELVDYADLAARHAAAASEGDARGQARRDQTALLQLQQARRELCWLRDVLDHQRRHRPGLGMAAVLAIAAFGGGFGLSASRGPDSPAGAGELACLARPVPAPP
jgi:hypothetical protein